MPTRFDNVVAGIKRFLEDNPEVKAKAILADDGSLRGACNATKIVADAMDAYNWLQKGDPNNNWRAFGDAVLHALD